MAAPRFRLPAISATTTIFSITSPGYVSATVTIASSVAKHLPTLGTVKNHQNSVWEIYAGATPALSNTPLLTTFLAASTGGASGGITNFKLAAGAYYAEFEGTSNFALKPAVSFSASPVPEMSTWAMLGLGFASLGFVGARSRKTARIAA